MSDPPPDVKFLSDQTEAWERYLRETQRLEPGRYGEVEPWAWRRLRDALKAARSRLLARNV